MKNVSQIKHAKAVLDTLSSPKMFGEVSRLTGLDSQTVQKVITQLHKHGHVEKTHKGLWRATGASKEQS